MSRWPLAGSFSPFQYTHSAQLLLFLRTPFIFFVWRNIFNLFFLQFSIDAPIQQKKASHTEQQKLKQIVSKNVNRSAETEIRSRATEGLINLSNAQRAVAKSHKAKEAAQPAAAPSTSASS